MRTLTVSQAISLIHVHQHMSVLCACFICFFLMESTPFHAHLCDAFPIGAAIFAGLLSSARLRWTNQEKVGTKQFPSRYASMSMRAMAGGRVWRVREDRRGEPRDWPQWWRPLFPARCRCLASPALLTLAHFFACRSPSSRLCDCVEPRWFPQSFHPPCVPRFCCWPWRCCWSA